MVAIATIWGPGAWTICNIRGMRANLLPLQAFLNARFDVFGDAETMLSDLVDCNTLKIDGYQKPSR